MERMIYRTNNDCQENKWPKIIFSFTFIATLAVAFFAGICYVHLSRRIIEPAAEAIQEKTMAHRIEIGFKKGIRDALGEKIRKRIIEHLRIPVDSVQTDRGLHHRRAPCPGGAGRGGPRSPLRPGDPGDRDRPGNRQRIRLAHRGGIPSRRHGQRGEDRRGGHCPSHRKAGPGLHIAAVRHPRHPGPVRPRHPHAGGCGTDRLRASRQRPDPAL